MIFKNLHPTIHYLQQYIVSEIILYTQGSKFITKSTCFETNFSSVFISLCFDFQAGTRYIKNIRTVHSLTIVHLGMQVFYWGVAPEIYFNHDWLILKHNHKRLDMPIFAIRTRYFTNLSRCEVFRFLKLWHFKWYCLLHNLIVLTFSQTT